MSTFSCLNCGSVFDEQYYYCSVCLEQGLVLPVPHNHRVRWDRPGRGGCRTVAQIRNSVRRGEVVTGFEVLGKLPPKFRMLVYGLAGSGKSSFALQFSNVYPGRVLYASLEEGHCESFVNKVIQFEITSPRLVVSDCQSMRELQNDLMLVKNPDLVVIDSITMLSSNEIPELQCSQIWIVHCCKDGNYKGDSSFSHCADIVIKCKRGVAYVEKNRFHPCGQKIVVFEVNNVE